MRLYTILLFALLIPAITTLQGQTSGKKFTVSGTVTDSDKKPVIGAMILIDNKKTDCVTNGKGQYKIKVKPDAVLITAFTIQNGTIEEKINGRTTIDFRFSTKGAAGNAGKNQDPGNEMVNVGYGSMKKSEMTTTVGKIDGQNKRFSAYTNIYDMIRGEVPGVQVNGKSIMIQGPSSINLSSEPLYVVDGMVVTSIDDIRPQQVKSIEVLKGPSASIYGSRGTNGVILISLVGVEKKK